MNHFPSQANPSSPWSGMTYTYILVSRCWSNHFDCSNYTVSLAELQCRRPIYGGSLRASVSNYSCTVSSLFGQSQSTIPQTCQMSRFPSQANPRSSWSGMMCTELFVPSVAMFCYVFLDELRWLAWAVGSCSVSQSAGGIYHYIIFKTLRQTRRIAL